MIIKGNHHKQKHHIHGMLLSPVTFRIQNKAVINTDKPLILILIFFNLLIVLYKMDYN